MSNSDLTEKSHKYIDILQATIQRMATNSSNCKAWCITVESGILVVVADKNQPYYVAITIIPILLFLYLDVFYLTLEKTFINKYSHFLKGIRADPADYSSLYDMVPIPKESWKKSVRSKSVYPFYLALITLSVSAFFLLNSRKQIVANPPETYKSEITVKAKSVDSSIYPEPTQRKHLELKH